MSAVAKAACLRKCRDCEETLLHSLGTGLSVVASARPIPSSGAAASWEILTAQSRLHAPGRAGLVSLAVCELYNRGVSVQMQVQTQVHSSEVFRRMLRSPMCPCVLFGPCFFFFFPFLS